MVSESKGSFFVRNAWILLLVVFILSLLIGIGDFFLAGDGDPALVESVSGIAWEVVKTTDPGVANLVNLLSSLIGSLWIGLSVMGIIVTATGFRNGNRWAWYALWSMPLVMLLIFITFLSADLVEGSPSPPALFSAPGLFVMAVLGLLLPFRKFFP